MWPWYSRPISRGKTRCNQSTVNTDRSLAPTIIGQTKSVSRRRGLLKWLTLATLLVAGGWYLGSVLFSVKTSNGTIVLEGDPAVLKSVVVTVDGDRVQLKFDGKNVVVDVDKRSGQLRVVTAGGDELYADSFTFRAGQDRLPIKVRLERQPGTTVANAKAPPLAIAPFDAKQGGQSQEEAMIVARDRLTRLQAKVSVQLEGRRRAVEAEPSDLNRRVELAIALDRAGLYDEALRHYAELSRRGGDNWSLYYNMGNAFRKLERYEEAVASYEKSLAMNPNQPRSYNDMGIALKKLGEYDRAIRAFEMATELDPTFASAPFNLATLYFRLGDKENASQAFDYVLRAFPELKSQANPYLKALQ